MNAHAEDIIEAIRFVGNKVTKEETMRLEMTVRAGDPRAEHYGPRHLPEGQLLP